MKTVKGIYAEAKIFTDDVEAYAEAQVKMICDNEVAAGSSICMMPDIHPGKIAPIGLSMTVMDKVIPQLLGTDIGCGVTCVKLNKTNAEFQKLDRVIRENVPSGFAIRRNAHPMAEEFSYEGLHCIHHINRHKAERSLGTLGGGNHFIELDKGDDGDLYLVVHTGSRHLGEEVAEYYTKLAARSLKEQGKEIPYYMSYLEADNKEAYVEDVRIIQRYAEWNYSAPHGSGRRLKRKAVKNQYTVSEFKKRMKGIYSSCIGIDTLDEAPFAYRSIGEIEERIKDTVEITERLKPIYNFKAGDKR